MKGTYNPQTNKYDEQPYLIGVEFTKDLNGIPWRGVGPKLTVYFNDTGVVAVKSVWRDVEEVPVGEYPVVDVGIASDRIITGKGLAYNDTGNTDVEASKVELVYWSDPLGVDQKYVIPHYVMSGPKFQGVARALPDNVLEEIPVKTPNLIAPEQR